MTVSQKQLTIEQAPGIVSPLEFERPSGEPVHSDVMHQAASIRPKSTTCNILYYIRPAQVLFQNSAISKLFTYFCHFLSPYLASIKSGGKNKKHTDLDIGGTLIQDATILWLLTTFLSSELHRDSRNAISQLHKALHIQ